MGIKYDKTTRRQFLIGSGKSLLALPILPSLLPREALAQATQAPTRMMLFWMDHNNLFSMWMNQNRATQPVGSDGVREVLLSSLNSMDEVSNVMNASIYNSLRNRDLLTFVAGYGSQGGSAHGNFGFACGRGRNSDGGYPTVDSIVERSGLYSDNTPASVQKAIRTTVSHGGFYEVNGGQLQQLSPFDRRDLLDFYDQVFSSLAPGSQQQQISTSQLKADILSGVTESYNSFRNGRRISSDDRARLDQHMDYISDLQRSLSSIADAPVISCDQPQRPEQRYDDDPMELGARYMQLLAVAFRCGITRFGIMRFEDHNPRWLPGLNIGNDGVHGCIHGDHGVTKKVNAFHSYWRYATNAVAQNFLSLLDTEEAETGRTYLENMITSFTCNGGLISDTDGGGHRGNNNQQILIGSMAGRLRAGRYYLLPEVDRGRIPYNCHMITLMQLLGVPQADYERYAEDGRGFGYYGYINRNSFQRRWYQPVTEMLNS